MNLHVFNDPHGFNLNITVDRFTSSGNAEFNIFWNLNRVTRYKHEKVVYLKKSLASYRKAIDGLPEIRSVHFYPLDDTGAQFLQILLKKQTIDKISWIFWSYEFYHSPALYALSLDQYSLLWYRNNNKLLQNIRQQCTRALKLLLQRPVSRPMIVDQARSQVTHFYSFLEQDFLNAYEGRANTPSWSRIAFYSIEQIAGDIVAGAGLSNEIMIGHAATLPSNHEMIIRKLSDYSMENQFLVPLVYGDDDYRGKVKRLAAEQLGGKCIFLEQRLSIGDYYQRLSRVGFAIFNFHFQEALGNIVFLLWNGAKVFLSEQSSPYKEFKRWGLVVFSFESELTKEALLHRLSEEHQQLNKDIMTSILSDVKVSEYWTTLFKG